MNKKDTELLQKYGWRIISDIEIKHTTKRATVTSKYAVDLIIKAIQAIDGWQKYLKWKEEKNKC